MKDDRPTEISGEEAKGMNIARSQFIGAEAIAPVQTCQPNKVSYNKDTNEDGSVSEYYEGNVDDVIKLIKEQRNPQPINQTIKIDGKELSDMMDKIIGEIDSVCDEEDELMYDQDDAIVFIMGKMGDNVYPDLVKTILNFDEDYMRSVGIIDGQ